MLSTTLRRLVSISGRAILAIGLTSATVLALAPSAKAADNVFLDNAEVEEISFTSTATTGSKLPLPATGLSEVSIGKITVKSNGPGYDVSATSASGGKLMQSAIELPYTLSVETLLAVAKPIGSTTTAIGSISSFDALAAATAGRDFDVKITVTVADMSGKPVGVYSDLLTFTLANK